MAFLFDQMGGSRSGFHMVLEGADAEGEPLRIAYYLVARSGHGPYIPCMPAILLARRLARNEIARRGAMPCLDLIDLDAYPGAPAALDTSVSRTGGCTTSNPSKSPWDALDRWSFFRGCSDPAPA